MKFYTCNLERLEIAFAKTKSLLNSRSELVGKCKHFAKFYLKKLEPCINYIRNTYFMYVLMSKILIQF